MSIRYVITYDICCFPRMDGSNNAKYIVTENSIEIIKTIPVLNNAKIKCKTRFDKESFKKIGKIIEKIDDKLMINDGTMWSFKIFDGRKKIFDIERCYLSDDGYRLLNLLGDITIDLTQLTF